MRTHPDQTSLEVFSAAVTVYGLDQLVFLRLPGAGSHFAVHFLPSSNKFPITACSAL